MIYTQTLGCVSLGSYSNLRSMYKSYNSININSRLQTITCGVVSSVLYDFEVLITEELHCRFLGCDTVQFGA
jgi:hypothetical protein